MVCLPEPHRSAAALRIWGRPTSCQACWRLSAAAGNVGEPHSDQKLFAGRQQGDSLEGKLGVLLARKPARRRPARGHRARQLPATWTGTYAGQLRRFHPAATWELATQSLTCTLIATGSTTKGV